ncbi:MAG TPA: hypothetical protein VMT87_03045 [Vicinamibacteria bacterium]|nr:hypothetical protein [Vicinamibacteria bacterium]
MRNVTLRAIMAVSVAGAACAKGEQSPPSPPVDSVAATPSPTPPPTPTSTEATVEAEAPAAAKPPEGRLSASPEAEAACVDRWLAARGLDPYGHPRGTMYTGGTPLFDERTGERVDRLQYVYKRQPLARAACRPTAVH